MSRRLYDLLLNVLMNMLQVEYAWLIQAKLHRRMQTKVE